MNAWLPQASYPCGNFSDTSRLKYPATKITKRSRSNESNVMTSRCLS
ncbi:hypothetical protein CcCBS67573_g02779 [Chytriomyces confervae]|uniref:Senescence-associated protein n=1 Tax=Chytriomyces confervae TaxID=246404 RepID=A0A507FHQ7_9FUNG|nr:hypothetical protein CcCBS67573_g02779 [Chytriomyces confervae]